MHSCMNCVHQLARIFQHIRVPINTCSRKTAPLQFVTPVTVQLTLFWGLFVFLNTQVATSALIFSSKCTSAQLILRLLELFIRLSRVAKICLHHTKAVLTRESIAKEHEGAVFQNDRPSSKLHFGTSPMNILERTMPSHCI